MSRVVAAAALALLCPVAAGCGGRKGLDGETVYQARCGYCHDADGGIGTPLTVDVLARYGTVGTLRSYLPLAMPYEAPGSLTPAEYDAALRHLLVSRGLIGEQFRSTSPPDSLAIGGGL